MTSLYIKIGYPCINDSTFVLQFCMAMNRPKLSPQVFLNAAKDVIKSAAGVSLFTETQRFKSLFGISPLVCSKAWNLLRATIDDSSRPVHFLWALLFLKTYATNKVLRALTRSDEKTLRKWTWYFIEKLSAVPIVG